MYFFLFIAWFHSIPNTADSLYQRGDDYYHLKDFQQAIVWYQHAVETYEQEEDFSGISKSLNDVGLCFYRLGETDSALWYYQKAYETNAAIGDSVKNIGVLRNIAIVHQEVGNYQQAILVIHSAEQLAYNLNSGNHLTAINTTLGNLYLNIEAYHKAQKHYNRALASHEKQQNQSGIAISLNNIGNAYEGLGVLDSALLYFQRSFSLKRKLGDSLSLAYTLHNIGVIYQEQGTFDSSMYYLKTAYNIRNRLSEQRGLAFTANEIANLYIETDQFPLAKPYLETAKVYALTYQNTNVLLENLSLWSAFYIQSQQPIKAYLHLQKWANLRDSLFNEERLKVQESQLQYEIQQSEQAKQIAEQRAQLSEKQRQSESRKANSNLLLAFILGVFLIASVIFLFKLRQQRIELNFLNAALGKQNKKVNLLYKENFHFTQNALAGMIAMINRQVKYMKNGQAKSLLQGEKLRVETVSLLYQQLFSKEREDDQLVNMPPYLN